MPCLKEQEIKNHILHPRLGMNIYGRCYGNVSAIKYHDYWTNLGMTFILLSCGDQMTVAPFKIHYTSNLGSALEFSGKPSSDSDLVRMELNGSYCRLSIFLLAYCVPQLGKLTTLTHLYISSLTGR